MNFSDDFFKNTAIQMLRGRNQKNFLLSHMKHYEELISASIPGLTVFNSEEFVYPDRIFQLNKNENFSLSEEILKEFKDCENLFLTNSDRFSYFPLNVRYKKDLYKELLLFWFSFFQEHKKDLDLILFQTTPHFNYDNIIYSIAKYFGIKTVIPEATLFKDKIIWLKEYESFEKVPKDFLENYGKEDVINFINPLILNEYLGESNYWNVSLEKNQQALIKQSNFFSKFKNILKKRKLLENFSEKKRTFKKIFQNPFKKVYSSYFFYNNEVSNIRFIYLYLKNILRTKKLFNYYQKHAVMPDDSDPYIFFALSYQPEKTSIPMAGEFEDLFLAIRLLSNSLPENYKIYVKEHPVVFHKGNYLFTKNFRDPFFYKRIVSLKNVKLININVSAKELIKKSLCTATLTNSAGWESLIHQKACLLFGKPWYAPCNAAFYVSSEEECRNAISEIKNLTSEEIELRVLKYIAYIKDRTTHSCSESLFVEKSETSAAELMNNYIEKINRFYMGEVIK